IAALEKARRLDSADSKIYLLLANAYKDLEHYSNAVVCLERALELDSNQVDAYLILSDIAILTGDIREALVWLSKYPESGSRFQDALMLMGDLKIEMGDTAGGLAVFRQCTQKSIQRMDAWLKLIELLCNRGAVYTAILESQRAIELNPSFSALAIVAGKKSFENGYYDKAEDFFRLAYNNGEPDGAVGLSNLLKVYEHYNDSQGIKRVKTFIDNRKK
ncbi:MAG: hypothetical protein GX640_22295, partial [Fibrobacter sp.]|nr:hypothetical protein [Fibrobacter sp.]